MRTMSQSVLILSASPRKGGNSDLLCDQFMKGAVESGNHVEKISVQDKKINFCIGCMTCQTNGGKCGLNDDMGEILEKMIKADVLVMATPIYFYNMDAQLKVLIDRTCSRYQEISNKKAYLITTCADTSETASDVTIGGFRVFLDCLNNVKEAGIISAVDVTYVGDIKDKPEMNLAYQMGKSV
ncbi:NAD(P)H-dependent oxidoreductase [uncultured Methanospirillum sp.]|uniref:flavodoxin family protein n=1 Tax=uncultured Methanospirillum sp. TaxID=262503 RepID=UPI0029C77791|nr:NAD(P)H-dependent oxidoreductase [uncultured Methanospirillum sp.]